MEAATQTWDTTASAALVPRRALSDKRLAVMAAGDDPAAFAELYRRYHQALYRYCRSLLGNEEEARDAVQMTFLSALRSLPGESRKIELKAWLYRVAHNESISILRSRRPVEGMDAIEELPQEDTATAAARRAELRTLVTDMGELSERQRGALVMRELSGLSYAEIAAALEISVGAAKQSVFKARTGLQELAEGREMVCSAVRQTISEADGRLLVARRIRGHLRGCAACRDFRTAIDARGAQLQMLAPPLAAAPAAQLLSGLLGGGAEAAAGTAGTATTAAAASAGAGKLAALSGASVAAKAMAIGAATVAVSAGAVGLNGGLPGSAESSSSSSPANGERIVPREPGLRNGSGNAAGSKKQSGASGRSGDRPKDARKGFGPKGGQGMERAGANRGGARPDAAATRPQGPAAAPVSPPAGRPSAAPAPVAGSGAGGGSAADTTPGGSGAPETSAPAPALPTSPSETSSSAPSSPVELPDDRVPQPQLP